MKTRGVIIHVNVSFIYDCPNVFAFSRFSGQLYRTLCSRNKTTLSEDTMIVDNMCTLFSEVSADGWASFWYQDTLYEFSLSC